MAKSFFLTLVSEKVEEFYIQLFSSSANLSETWEVEFQRAPLLRHSSEDMPEIEDDEISEALGQLKNGRAPGGRQIQWAGWCLAGFAKYSLRRFRKA